MDSVPHKTCTRCKQTKPVTEFNRDKSRRDGYRDRCKDCIRAYQAEWLPRYVAQVQEQRQELAPPATKRCTECGKEKPLADYHRTPNTIDGRRPICKSCACDYQYDHRRDPRYAEQIKAGDRRKYHTMLDAKRKRHNRRGHERHKERYHSDPEYRASYKEFANAKFHKRRARKAGNGGSHTPQEWLELCAKYDHRCLCCGRRKPLTKDHVMPIENGGTDDISNIQPLCKSCNSTKGARTIDYRPS